MVKYILVAGGAGFIGSHLCERLLKDPDNHVICIDNLSTSKMDNIQHLLNNPKFIFHKSDISKDSYTFKGIDEIYNLACPASPIHYQKDPIQTLKTSVLGALNLLELARMNNAKILQASTSEVYGEPSLHPQKETYWGNVNPIGIRSCYDEGKRCVETLFMDYHRQYGADTKIIRIFNTYGPRMMNDDGRVIPNFINQALRDEPITIYGDGSQTRSFQYIDDLIEGMIMMMASDETGPINLGNPNEMSILHLANYIIQLTDSKSKLVFNPLPKDDPTRRCPDISLAKKALGWRLRVNIENGLINTIDYFKNF